MSTAKWQNIVGSKNFFNESLIKTCQKNTLFLFFFYFSDDGSTTGCKDSTSEIWKSNNMESKHGNLCEKFVGPYNKCDKTWSWCDSKNCGEFCKKTCNKCTGRFKIKIYP